MTHSAETIGMFLSRAVATVTGSTSWSPTMTSTTPETKRSDQLQKLAQDKEQQAKERYESRRRGMGISISCYCSYYGIH